MKAHVLWGLVLSLLLVAQSRASTQDNEIESVSEILSSIYDACLPKWSYTCLQKKVLVFVDRLDRVESVSLAEGWAMVKRRGRALEAEPITEEDLKSVGEGRAVDSESTAQILHDMLDNRIVSFFQSRALKFTVPSELAAVVTGRSSGPQSMEVALAEDTSEGE